MDSVDVTAVSDGKDVDRSPCSEVKVKVIVRLLLVKVATAEFVQVVISVVNVVADDLTMVLATIMGAVVGRWLA